MSSAATVTVKLKKPITYNDIEYKELHFREAEVGDLMVADSVQGEFSRDVAVLASISGVPLPAFRKIKISDMNLILSKAAELMGNEPVKPTTGEA
ncbi:phage tail assembly protein [Ochrobactrum sp. MR28]|nr:phage tail assembly protein [Ochrobactrum sp. MR28]MBX8818950.1 phage tail assembly protein [Ochrobactrum sp. MR31]